MTRTETITKRIRGNFMPRLSTWKGKTARVTGPDGEHYWTNGHMIVRDDALTPAKRARLHEYWHEHGNRWPPEYQALDYDNLLQVAPEHPCIEYHYVGPLNDDDCETPGEQALYVATDGEHCAVVDSVYCPPPVLFGEYESDRQAMGPLTSTPGRVLDYVLMPMRPDRSDKRLRDRAMEILRARVA